MSSATSAITIKIEDHASRDTHLELATSLLRKRAAYCGLVPTGFDFTTFTVALSPNFPFGLIREIDLL